MSAKTNALLWSLLLGVACSAYAQSSKVERQRQLEPEIKTFEEADQKKPPPKGAVLFIGSSSIRLWKSLAEDFPAVRIINRGFGGSHIEDSIDFADRIVFRYRPRLIVLYAGDNDIESGKSPAVVLEDFKKFVALVHQKLPRTRIAFISIKPSPARWHLAGKVREANRLIKDFTETDRRLRYIDVFTPMLGKDGNPRGELFVEDRLHMNEAGYALWRSIVAPYVESNRYHFRGLSQ
ncbi:MAG: SGNH/GDSL hydrolase family protein [Acidobacteriota bacterium]|nr:SGNH/GDSL hydrolase family protein [Acidobacteriota bacterium]